MFTSELNLAWGGQDSRVPGIAGILPAQPNPQKAPRTESAFCVRSLACAAGLYFVLFGRRGRLPDGSMY